MQTDRLNNERYLHWIRTSLSLLYLKAGVAKFSNEKAGEFHNAVTESVRLKDPRAAISTCSTCTHKNAVKTKTPDKTSTTWRINCSTNICNLWFEEILPYHQHSPFPNIAWANSNPQSWPSHVWEVAKLFQPHGCERHTKAEDSDCTGLLTMMLDCRYFHRFLSNTTVLQEIKDVRNACMHSGDLEMDEPDMRRGLELMVSLLEEPELKNRPECIAAKAKITQLRDNVLDLSLNKELELQALNHKIAEVRNDMDKLAAEHQQLQSALDDIMTRQDSTVEECHQICERMWELSRQITQVSKTLEVLQQAHDPTVAINVTDLKSQLKELDSRNQEEVKSLRSMTETIESRLQGLEARQKEEEQHRLEEDNIARSQKVLIDLYEKHCQRVPIYPLRFGWKRRVEDL